MRPREYTAAVRIDAANTSPADSGWVASDRDHPGVQSPNQELRLPSMTTQGGEGGSLPYQARSLEIETSIDKEYSYETILFLRDPEQKVFSVEESASERNECRAQ